MDAALGLALGLLTLLAGASILFDIRGFGARLMRFSLYTSAPIWRKDARSAPEDVDSHRVMFSAGVTMVALVIVAMSISGLS